MAQLQLRSLAASFSHGYLQAAARGGGTDPDISGPPSPELPAAMPVGTLWAVLCPLASWMPSVSQPYHVSNYLLCLHCQ